MGIIADTARMLLDCRQRGVSFRRTLMIGRQNVFISGPEFRHLLKTMGLDGDERLRGAVRGSGEYAESLFRGLGAEVVDSLDASDFEGANRIHDLNQPVPAEWHESYDFVYDGGTLEHVFDFLVAIGNCMRMTKTGGRLVLHTPANNFLGHGLYQFSPELFFRMFSAANGFELDKLLAVESGIRTRWFEVVDPLRTGMRGQVANRAPIWLHVEGRKKGPTPERLQPAQQSDYQARWETHSETGEAIAHLADAHHRVDPRLRRLLLTRLPRLTRMIERAVGIYWKQEYGLRNAGNYRRIR